MVSVDMKVSIEKYTLPHISMYLGEAFLSVKERMMNGPHLTHKEAGLDYSADLIVGSDCIHNGAHLIDKHFPHSS